MPDALAVTPADGLDQLREVEVRDVDADTLVRLDFVKQIPSLREFEREPYPRIVFSVGQELDDVGVSA